MAVLYTPHYAYFTDTDGNPLAGGKLYTYEAGTTTPKATYTAADGLTPNANPIILDASGRATLFLSGAYKFRLETSANVLVEETDNVDSFATSDSGVDDIIANFSADTMVEADSIIFADVSDGNATKRTTLANLAASTDNIRTSAANKIVMAEEMGGLLGWQLLSTQTAASSATIDFTSAITSTFDDYLIVASNVVPVTDNVTISMRTSSNNGSSYDSGATDYSYAGVYLEEGSATVTSFRGNGVSSVPVMSGSGNNTGESGSFELSFIGVNTSLYKLGKLDSIQVYQTGNQQTINHGWSRKSTSAINAVRFFASSGNILTGTFRLYGLKK